MSSDMTVLAIDPGTHESAYCLYDGQRVTDCGILRNPELLIEIKSRRYVEMPLAIEMVASYGMPVGKEVFETVLWIGRYIEAWSPLPSYKVYRQDVKLHLCKSARAKDSNVSQALIDRFGPGRRKAVGLKKDPGPLYGVKSHIWSALAVAVTWHDQQAAS